MRVLKEADEAVGALSALFGGGSQSGNLGNLTIAGGPSGLASMLSGKEIKYTFYSDHFNFFTLSYGQIWKLRCQNFLKISPGGGEAGTPKL